MTDQILVAPSIPYFAGEGKIRYTPTALIPIPSLAVFTPIDLDVAVGTLPITKVGATYEVPAAGVYSISAIVRAEMAANPRTVDLDLGIRMQRIDVIETFAYTALRSPAPGAGSPGKTERVFTLHTCRYLPAGARFQLEVSNTVAITNLKATTELNIVRF